MLDFEDLELGHMPPVERVRPVRAFRQGKRAWIELPTKRGRMMRVSHEFLDGVPELGAIPLLAYGIGAVASALTAYAMSSDDEWETTSTFNTRVRAMTVTMREMNDFADKSCSNWRPQNPKYAEWKRLINGFGGWKAEISFPVSYVYESEAAQAKEYSRRLAQFAKYFETQCQIPSGYTDPQPTTNGGGWGFLSGLGTGGLIALGLGAYLLLRGR